MVGGGVNLSTLGSQLCKYLLSMWYMYMQSCYQSTCVVYMVVLYELLKGCTCLSAVDPLVSCLYTCKHIHVPPISMYVCVPTVQYTVCEIYLCLPSACPSNRYGPNCQNYCWCYGNSHCHLSTGHCVCPPGYKGYSCYQGECGHVCGAMHARVGGWVQTTL